MKFENKLAQDVFDSCNEHTQIKIAELLEKIKKGKVSVHMFKMLLSIVNESNTQHRENVVSAANIQIEKERVVQETKLGMASIYAAVENNSE